MIPSIVFDRRSQPTDGVYGQLWRSYMGRWACPIFLVGTPTWPVEAFACAEMPIDAHEREDG